MKRLQQLLASIAIEESYQAHEELEISGIAYHTKEVKPGYLFVCIRGYKTDGHKYLPKAIENGAIATIVEEIQEGVSIPQYRVQNSRLALAQLANAYYGEPSKQMKMIGITATNGKTTTSFMTNAILQQHGYNTGLIGTVFIKFGRHAIPADLTTPESLDLQNYLRQMVDEGVSHVTMEVSSAALESHRVHGVDYDFVSLHNIDREHIDHHGSYEKYIEAKTSLIRNAKSGAVAVLNLEDPISASLVHETKAHVITFSVQEPKGDLVCKNLDLSTGRANFTVEITREIELPGGKISPASFDIELKVPGLHSVYNSMVAIAFGLANGVSIPTIQEALRTFAGVERRFEYIFEGEYKILDDHFANAGNIDVTLGTLQYMDYRNFMLVYAIRGSRGPTVNRENAEAIVKWAGRLGLSEVIATKSKYHVTEKDIVTDEEEQVFMDVMNKAGIKVHLYEELPAAILHALRQAKEGDVILLAGCQGMDYGAEVALQLLAELNPHLDKDELFAPLRHRVAGVTVTPQSLATS